MTTRDELNTLVEAELVEAARGLLPHWDDCEPLVQAMVLSKLRALAALMDGKAQRPEGSAKPSELD